MAKQDNIRGVEKIEIGAAGDGVVGTSLTTFKGDLVVLNSITFTGTQANEETIATEGSDNYLTLNTGSTPASLNFKLLGVEATNLVMLMGGAYDAATKEWKAPKTAPDIYLSVVLTSEAIDSKKKVISLPYAKIVARYDGSITKSSLLDLDIVATANMPVAADGTEGNPYSIKTI